MSKPLSPDKQLRLDVYREGQIAHGKTTKCPYTDWRMGTWWKGFNAAKEYKERLLAEAQRPPDPDRCPCCGQLLKDTP